MSIVYRLDTSGANHLLLSRQIKPAIVKCGKAFAPVSTPRYQDAGLAQPFQARLAVAEAGDFHNAAVEFRRAVNLAARDPHVVYFPEADFMLGVTAYARGDLSQALRQWRVTLIDPGLALPEQENFGPGQPWLWALDLYATQYLVPQE